MQLAYGGYVGRVGALAVALGIGAVVTVPAGVALASPEQSSAAPAAPDRETTGASGSDTEPEAPRVEPDGPNDIDPQTRSDTDSALDVPRTGAANPAGDEDAGPKPRKRKGFARGQARAAGPDRVSPRTAEQAPLARVTLHEPGAPTRAATVGADITATPPSVAGAPPVLPAKPVVANPVQVVRSLIGSALRPVLSTVLGILPGGAGDSPLAWALLAAARRQVGVEPAAAIQTAAVSRTVAAAVTDAPPSATVIWGRPDATTGTVVGQLIASDPEGKKVAVSVVPPATPVPGTLSYNAKTATLTYTPTTAQRFAAWATPGEDVVAITLRVTDGVNVTGVAVNMPVSPSPFYAGAAVDLTEPSAVAATNTRAYITDRAAGTVTVYDTVNNTVLATFEVGGAPDGIAVKRDGTRLYVSSSTTDTVTVVDAVTGAKKATITVANPTAIAINPGGSVLYVASGTGATVTKITTSNNRTAGTVRLDAAVTPTHLAVSADGKRIFVAGTTPAGGQLSWFSSTAKVATILTATTAAPTGLAYSSVLQTVYAVDAGGGLTVHDLTKKTTSTLNLGHALTGIVLTLDSSAAMVTTGTGLVAALAIGDATVLGVADFDGLSGPTTGMVLSPDGTRMLFTDLESGVVHFFSLVPVNRSPFSNDPSYAVTNPATGATTGTVGVVDFDGDPLTYQLTGKPTKGKLVLKADGTYTYTPTAAARHAAAKTGAPATVSTDSFTVVVSDGRYGTFTQTITIAIDPANKVPTVGTTIGNPNSTTGIVKGTVKVGDGDRDKVTFSWTDPGKGSVSVSTGGGFTYTPTAAALAAAKAAGATYSDKTDTFTITVDDGHGGVVPVVVNVKIGAPNIKPVWATPTIGAPQDRSGVIGGAINAGDADGDPLNYTVGKTTKGTFTVNPDGSFTYTPTAAARAAASKRGASAAAKSETVSVTVSDGFGGTVTKTIKLTILKNPTTNVDPANGAGAVTGSTSALGAVTGVVTADDADGDALTYSLGSGPAHGTVKVRADGQFTYIPDVDARYRALVSQGEDTDSFVVDITDGFGGITTATVHVTITPPSTTAIDQRATTVAVNVQQMYFYSQADTDTALGLLKAAGVGTIRILLPWAGAEPEDDTFDWSAVDRMVDSAAAHGIKVLATINTTPDWAATPGQPQYKAAPADLVAFGDFVSAVATRYQGKVADYEIWNEPNYNGFWAPTPDAAAYTALLKIAYTAIKAADPTATVIGGSVAAVAEVPGGPAVNPVTYLSQMYAAGAGGYFDALAFHPYMYSVPFSAGEGRAGVPFVQAQQLYAVMVDNGDGNKKIWATEYGQPVSEGGEATQADYVGDFLRAWRDLDFAGPAFIHTLADYDDPVPHEATMGIFRPDWTPKPVVGVITAVIAENQAINAGVDAL
ncbi:Ig-like domain-containing protein [Mycobacterium sp. AMU20-3851]|uniref:Ig-like domain-containing protein n=1 Tax=Mycobacterium sp. AMU20-3851 TaxID=3122055 RepID=UPI003753F74D